MLQRGERLSEDYLKRIAILGSTGSIGQQALEVVRAFPERFQVVGLAAGKNVQLLANQVEEFRPQIVYFEPLSKLPPALANSLRGSHKALSLEEIASSPEVDLVVIATSGKAGLAPALAALKEGKDIALANKEVLVMAGEIITTEAKQYGARVLPLDSEHSAIWQCWQGEQRQQVSRLILTASGGPFLHYPSERLAQVTPEEALQHPTWQMGRKVTIDSATLMNKGMEIIEAHWLFDMPWERIEVVIHPESIVHSMVEFVDSSIKAQLSLPDMHLPIQYALFYPERRHNPQIRQLDLSRLSSLTFQMPDEQRFPCLRLAREAGRQGGTYPAVLCAADEIVVELFLSHRLGFMDIARVVEYTLEQHTVIDHPSLQETLAADAWARETAARVRHGAK